MPSCAMANFINRSPNIYSRRQKHLLPFNYHQMRWYFTSIEILINPNWKPWPHLNCLSSSIVTHGQLHSASNSHILVISKVVFIQEYLIWKVIRQTMYDANFVKRSVEIVDISLFHLNSFHYIKQLVYRKNLHKLDWLQLISLKISANRTLQ